MTQTNRKSAPCLSHLEEQLKLKREKKKKREEVREAAERCERLGVQK